VGYIRKRLEIFFNPALTSGVVVYSITAANTVTDLVRSRSKPWDNMLSHPPSIGNNRTLGTEPFAFF
jgi:hypothetical protein